MDNIKLSLQEAWLKVEEIRRKVDSQRSNLGEANCEEISSDIGAFQANLHRQLQEHEMQRAREEVWLRKLNRLRGKP